MKTEPAKNINSDKINLTNDQKEENNSKSEIIRPEVIKLLEESIKKNYKIGELLAK